MCSYTWMYCTASHTGGHVRQTGFLWQSWLTACGPQARPGSRGHFNSVPGPRSQGHTNTQCGSVVGDCEAANLYVNVCLTSSQHQEVTSDSTCFIYTSSPGSSSIFHYMLIAFLCSETWGNTTYSQLSQPANQYVQRYHFHVVTSHSLSKLCLSNRGRSAERACGDASRQRCLLTQM